MFNATDKETSQLHAQRKADEADAIASWDELREVWLFSLLGLYFIFAKELS